MDLNKIAENTEMTYLEKVSAIVDEFAAGNVDGETADAIAESAGISPEDLLSVYNASYGEGIEKTASAEDGEAEMTYLEKVATVVDEFAAGELTADDVAAIAEEHGLDAEDINSVYAAAYGDEAEEEVSDIEKTAADEAVAELLKVAEDENSTYLEKTAAVVDAYMNDALDDEELEKIAEELNVDLGDVEAITDIAYMEKLAMSPEEAQKLANRFARLSKYKTKESPKATVAKLVGERKVNKSKVGSGKAIPKKRQKQILEERKKATDNAEQINRMQARKSAFRAGQKKAKNELGGSVIDSFKNLGGKQKATVGGAAALLGTGSAAAGYAAGDRKAS